MAIRARLWAGFAMMMGAVAALAALVLAALVAVDRQYSELLDVRQRMVMEAIRLKAASQAEILAARSYLLTGEPAFLEAMRDADAEQAAQLATLRQLGSAPGGEASLDDIEAVARLYDQLNRDDVPEQGDGVGAVDGAGLRGEPAKQQLTALLDRYIADQQAALDQASAQTTVWVRRTVLAVALGVAVASLATAVVAWWTSRIVLVPLSGLVTATRALQGGRADQPPLPDSADEIGELGRAFGEMRRAVAEREAALSAERARAESILRSLAEGLCLLAADGRIAYVNPRVGELLGCRPSALVGRRPVDVLPELGHLAAEPRRSTRAVLRAIRRADPRMSVDVPLAAGGRHVRLTVFPVSGPEGATIGRGLLVRDVSAERESERLHATFLNLVSHELRTPLGAIKGFTSALRQENLPLDGATRREFLGGIEAATDQLTRIVAEIMDLSRIEAGALAVQREPCGVLELARATLRDLAPELSAASRVKLEIPSDLPPLLADPLLTRQALRGLLDNALRYSPARQTVRLVARLEGQHVVLRVIDRGAGLAAADLGRIFEPFYRAGRTESGGLGLGLAITRGLIRAQGGDVWAESRPGRGATFSVTLPAVRSPVGVGS